LKLPRVPLSLHFAVLSQQSVPILTVSFQGCSPAVKRKSTDEIAATANAVI
jgi:hypothetical protein